MIQLTLDAMSGSKFASRVLQVGASNLRALAVFFRGFCTHLARFKQKEKKALLQSAVDT